MKVTVCFGEVRVLVPCGAGDLLVRDLVREATHRYKKATGKGPESWVEVRALRASSGGILDPDDRVRDVADDRETLAAECAGAAAAALPALPPPPPPPRQHGGDGASGSSVGTASPDMFRGGCDARRDADLGVDVVATDLEGTGGLQVRRGSEPTLHQDSLPVQAKLNEHTKRWSAAVVCREDACTQQRTPSMPPEPPPDAARAAAAQPFQRHTNRLSMQFSGPGSGVWLDAAERVQTISTKSLPRDSRKEPLGQDTVANDHQNHRVEDMLRWVSGVNGTAEAPPLQDRPQQRIPEVNGGGGGGGGAEVAVGAGGARAAAGGQLLSVALVKGERGLGFTITTRDNPTGGHAPIYIKTILPKGAAVMDGRLRAGDRLVSVNGAPVSGLAQQQVVAVLRNTPADSTVTLLVERPRSNTQRVEPQQSPAKYAEKAIGSPNSVAAMNKLGAKTPENGRVSGIVSAFNQSCRRSGSGDDLKRNTSDSALHDTLNTSNASAAAGMAGLRRRQVLRLEVPVHDSEKAGLGVSVKGKVTVGAEPQDLGIFVKSVLNGGAASRDGRLHTNDQLLNVNGVSLVGQSNAEAMETLRRALLHSRGNQHGTISLTVARRTESMDSLARWKDDTPPSGHESSGNSTSDGAHTTVICRAADARNNNVTVDANHNHKHTNGDRASGKRHASIVNINNNGSWVSNQSDDSKGCAELETPERDPKRDSFEWSRLDGWNPVVDRLTGLRNESYYMATQTEPTSNGHAAHPGHPGLRYGHLHLQRSPPHHNVIIEEDYGTTTKARSPASNGGVYESGSESAGETAFSRDAVGRRSMSEKRHAAVDAKTTGTYKKIKEQKAINALQSVGPTLGMRKSSSLESLQTAVQEQQRQPIYSARLHQHPPLKHWLTDSEPTGAAAAGETMVRGSPQQSSLSHKKPSLLKSLSSMLRFGKQPKKPDEIYGRTAPGRASEKSLSREALERSQAHAERALSERGLSERGHSDRGHSERGHSERGHSERGHSERGHSERDRSERSNTDRVQSDRGHADRGLLERGQADRGHERLAGDTRVPEHLNHRSVAGHARQASGEEERRTAHAPPYRLPPARAAPSAHTMSQVMEGAWGASGHYVNYEEIQQNLNARREKLSEVQIGQMRRQVHQQRARAEEESRRAGVGGGYHSQRSSREAAAAARPQSNYYEYESVAPPPHARAAKLHYH